MIMQYINYFLGDFLPGMFQFLDSLLIADGASFLRVYGAIVLLCIVIGAILLRV